MDINTFKIYVSDKLKSRYELKFKDNFDDIIMLMIDEIEKIAMNPEVEYKKLFKKIKATKKRYIDTFMKNKETDVYVQLTAIRIEYKKVVNGEISLEEFQSFFQVSSVEEYEKNLFSKIINWKDKEEALLTEFPYLDVLSKKSVKSAFKNDILLSCYYYIKNTNVAQQDNSNIKMIPSVFGTLPIDTTNKATYISEEEVTALENEIMNLDTIDKLICDNKEEKEKLIMKLEKDAYLRIVNGKDVSDVLTQIALIRATKAMNNLDKEIISYFFSLFYNAPLASDITCYVSEIAEGCGLTKNKKNYINIKDSIKKLSRIVLEHHIEDASVIGNMINVYMDKDNDRDKIVVSCGPFLKKLLIMNSSYNFDKASYDNLSRDAQQYAVWYQKRRLKQALHDSQYEETITITKAMEAIVWNTVRFDRRIKRIVESLSELKANKLVIKDYFHDDKRGTIKISYIPLPQSIVEKIMSKNFQEGQLIEGKIVK